MPMDVRIGLNTELEQQANGGIPDSITHPTKLKIKRDMAPPDNSTEPIKLDT